MEICSFDVLNCTFVVRKPALIVKNWPSLKLSGYSLTFCAVMDKFKV